MPLKVEQLIKSLVNATEVKQLYDRVSSKISFQAEELSSTCFELARIHHYGLGSTPKDLDKAFRLYVKAAKKNHPIAQFVICQLYDWEKNSIDSTEDIERMIAFKAEMYVNSASQSVYYCGAHEELYRHCKKSVSWRDIINSMELKFYSRLKFEEDTDKSGYNYNRLGYVLILKGSWNILERKKSYKKAIKCFRKAAKLGNADAYWNISYWIYYLGYGYPKNISKYNKYLKLAADYGHPVAISIMVSLYYSEDLKDLNSSYCCRGYVEFLYRNFPTAFASYYFALMFLYGLGGVKKNPLLAIQLLEESVVRSDFIFSFANQWSSFLLAFIYYKGIGAKKDITAAMHYFALAASLGYDEAYPYIAKLLLQHKLLPSADKKASLLLHFAKDNSPIDTSTNRLATYYLGKMKANDDHSGSLKESKEYLDQTFVSYRASLVEDPSANVYYRLGRILESDFGRYRDFKKARMYYRLAYNASLKTRNQFTRLYGEKAKKRVQTDSKRRRKMIRDETETKLLTRSKSFTPSAGRRPFTNQKTQGYHSSNLRWSANPAEVVSTLPKSFNRNCNCLDQRSVNSFHNKSQINRSGSVLSIYDSSEINISPEWNSVDIAKRSAFDQRKYAIENKNLSVPASYDKYGDLATIFPMAYLSI